MRKSEFVTAKPFSLLFQVSSFFYERLFRKAATSVPSGDILLFFAFFAFSSLVANSCTSEIPYSYIYFFLVAQKSFSHHAGARKERLLRVLFLDVVVHLSSRAGGVFFYYDDRLKFRAIITMEIFNTIRSAVFSLSLDLRASRKNRSFRKRRVALERRYICR